MSPLTLIALLGFGALLPIFENSNTDDSDETADPPDTDPAPVVDGSSGDDLLSAVLSETLNGAEGDDTLIAEETSDGAVLNGGQGADSLSLFGTNGTLNGGLGADRIEAFLSDAPPAGAPDTSVINGDEGDDTILAVGRDGTINGGDGDDVIDVQGQLGGVFGGEGDDTIHGGALDSSGGSPLSGGAGNDVLSTSDDAGFDYRSELTGGEGNDTLTTELLGAAPIVLDVLSGGAGNDVLAASLNSPAEDPSAGVDLGTLFEVADFDATEDTLLVEIGDAGVFLAEIDAPNRITFSINDLEDGSGALLEFMVINADASGPLTGSILLSGVTSVDPAAVELDVQFVEFV